MTRLPRALSRWNDQLSIFPPDVGQLLGALLVRLAPAFDATARASSPPSGEINGFDGLSRRGSYERLLPMDWLLARALPLEFMRRAANAEHLFFKLAHHRPALPLGTVALFEAGPGQLGASRLAQLAILVLLSERCERAGAAFGWQLLHHQGEPLYSTLNENSVRSFLGGRTGLRTGPAAVTSWSERFPREELWLVGAATTLQSFHQGARTVEICERVALDQRVLDVRVAAPRAKARSIALELPENALAVRVLRDPFDAKKRSPAGLPESPSSNLLLNPAGSRLFYRDARGDLVGCSVPSLLGLKLGTLRHYQARPGMRIAAVGKRGRTIVWLSIDRERAVLSATRFIRRDIRSTVLQCEVPSMPEPERLGRVVVFADPLSAVFVAPDGHLYRLSFPDGRCELIGEGARALVPLRNDAGAVCAIDNCVATGRPGVVFINATAVTETSFTMYARSAVFLRTLPHGTEEAVVCATQRDDGAFRVERAVLARNLLSVAQGVNLHVPSRATVVSVDIGDPTGGSLGLIFLDRGSSSLCVAGMYKNSTLLISDARIRDVSFASAGSRFVCTNDADELIVGERNGTLLYRGKADTS